MSLIDPFSQKLGRIDWQLVIVCIILWFLSAGVRGDGLKPVSLVIYPHAVIASEFQRATIKVEWRIPRHEDNRKWQFVYEADNGDYSLSEGSMDGQSAVIYPICIKRNERACYRDVAPGIYLFKACVYRTTETFCDRFTLIVGGG